MADALLTGEGIGKSFPGVRANEDVSFSIGRGEIHALLGENGAGKSTLVKILYGVMQPDAGHMTLDGRRYAPPSPGAARAAGVGMVFQHFTLFEQLTVAENIALGLPGTGVGRDLEPRIAAVAAAYGLALDPARQVATLSVGERQKVEIVRVLLQKPRLLIMDEPTSVLTPQESDNLFRALRQVRDEGCSVLYISHKLDEVRALCSQATVLRGGKVVARCEPQKETSKSLAEMMLGATLRPSIRASSTNDSASSRPVRLAARALSLPKSHDFGVTLDAIGFEVRAGEILGIAGVAGNGQTELMEALIGERLLPEAGQLQADGKPIGRLGPSARRDLGLAFVPEERLGHGAVPGLSLAENVLLSARGPKQLVRRAVIDGDAAAAYASSVVRHFDVRTAGVDKPARSLSGGNLQKYVVGREVLLMPSVLVVSQPTWGVDAGAAAAIHQALFDLAAGGSAVLVISQDLDELLAISDQVAVIAGGRLTAARPVAETTVEALGRAMGGAAAA